MQQPQEGGGGGSSSGSTVCHLCSAPRGQTHGTAAVTTNTVVRARHGGHLARHELGGQLEIGGLLQRARQLLVRARAGVVHTITVANSSGLSARSRCP